MAIQTHVIITDDLDGSEGASTVNFGLDGKNYEIDLSDKNAAKLRKALQPFMDAGRSSGKTAGRSKRSNSSGGKPAEVRAWARDNGYDVPDRGRIPSEIREAYESAEK